MHRKLCPTETLYVAQRSRAVLSCTVRGDLDEELLAAAFAAKVAEHPSLAARIGQHDGAYAFQPLDDADLPRLVVRPGGPTALMDEHNTPLPDGGHLVRAALLRGTTEHTFVLSVDHTVTDGHSAIALHDAVWRAYAALADGLPLPAAAPGGLPAPATDRLPAVTEEETERYLARRVERTRRLPITALPYEAAGTGQPAGRHKVDVRRVLLGPDETARLLRHAKETGVSVHGLVSSALLRTVRRRLGDGPGAKALGCMSPVDLRSRVTPPLAREVMVPAVTSYLDVLEVAEDTDPLELGRQVVEHLHDAIERGDYTHEARILGQVVRNPALLATTVIVTNMGRVATPPAPRGLDITDVRLIPVRDNYYPQAGRGPVMACVVSFGDSLAIELPYSTECFGHEQIDEIRDGVHAALLAFAGPGTD
ncbi:phthiocerol/phthiodiolone dimycocerosyl transferase family protein [Streptomyces sp. NPDC002537]